MILNKAHFTNMRLEIPDANATATFVNSASSVTIPSLEMDIARVSINQMASGMMPGSKITYEPFRVRFLVDENWDSYKEIYQWMISVTDSRTFNSTAHLPGRRPRSMLVHLLDNHKRNIVMTLKFNDPFPYSIDEFDMSYTEEGNPAIYGMVTFGYASMSVVVGQSDKEILPKNESLGVPSMHPAFR